MTRARVVVLLLALAAPAAFAQVLYKWIDANGKVVYSDRMPAKGFNGSVEKIETDPAPDNPPAPRPNPNSPAKKTETSGPAVDVAKQRRETRERLQAQLESAQVRFEAARKALEDAQDPREEDRRVVQRRIDPNSAAANAAGVATSSSSAAPDAGAASPGIGMAPRANCRTTKDANGKDVKTCATSLLTDEYLERVEKLEELLRAAEEQLTLAQRNYRRGVD